MSSSSVPIPKSPPDLTKILRSLTNSEDLLRVWNLPAEAAPRGYPHWDKLIRYEPPEGFTDRTWWLALKMQRRARRKELKSFVDAKGNSFGFVEPDPIPESLHEIDMRAGGSVEMPDPITNAATRDRYYVSSLIEEAITSSQLEGATTTRQIAKDMILRQRAPRDQSERMILNNYLTMRRIGEIRNEPLTKELVFELHRQVTDSTLDDAHIAGRFRRSDEEIAVMDNYGTVHHEPPPAEELEERMKKMCAFANGDGTQGFVHPVIRSIILHFWLAYDHPFVDGNGRTARALFYWSMQKHGFWLFEFVSISSVILKAPKRYARAFLETESDENDLTYFVLHQLEVIRRAIKELHEYIGRKTNELQTLESILRDDAELNHRQRALLTHALRNPNQKYTFESHRRSHNIVYQTARNDLMDLETKGLLVSSKIGRAINFSPAKNLEALLKKLRA